MRIRARRWEVWLVAAGALTLGVLLSACGILDSPPPPPAPTVVSGVGVNNVTNGGFETGAPPWTFKEQPEWSGFSISDSVAHSGSHSLALQLRGDPGATGTHIAGAIQPIATKDFPEYLSGFYRVDSWKPDAPFQYLQFVVIVHGGDFGGDSSVVEMRFPLAGADREPFNLSNARFIFLSRDQPRLHQWVYFGYPLRTAFQTAFGKVPTRWDSIEVFLEVRYDGKTAASGPSSADVYFDDIYAGTQALNPNRPPDP